MNYEEYLEKKLPGRGNGEERGLKQSVLDEKAECV